MRPKRFDLRLAAAAAAAAVCLGLLVAKDPIAAAAVTIPVCFATVVLCTTGSPIAVVVIGSGVYAGTVGILHLVPFPIPGLQLNDIVTLGFLAASVLAILTTGHDISKSWWRSDSAYLLLLAWVFLRVYGTPSVFQAAKDCVFLLSFWALGTAARLYLREHPQNRRAVLRSLFVGASICMMLILLFFLLGRTSWNEGGFATPLGKRTLALYLLIILSVSLAQWRLPETRGDKLTGLAFTILCGGVILITMSRTVILTIIVIYVPILILSRSGDRGSGAANPVKVLGYFAAVAALAPVVLRFEVIQERLFFSTSATDSLSLLRWDNLNTMGRATVWPIVFHHATTAPVTGHGTGSVRVFAEAVSGWEHPHSDYLRVFHDQGIVGLILFGLFWTLKIGRLWRQWRAPNMSVAAKRSATAALMATAAVVISFGTDNTIVYTFVMLPLAILLALAENDREAVKEPASASRQTTTRETIVGPG